MKNKSGYGMKNDSNKIAQMTPDDRKVLRDHAETLKRQGGRQAAKELEKMNKMYSKYGMSFGTIDVKGV